MSIKSTLSRLYQADVTWRTLDAFSPRILALFLHTGALAAFGAAGYAVIAWITSVFALTYSLLPDPHSYVLVRRQGKGALRLAGLVTPVIVAKGFLALTVSGLSAHFFLTQSLRDSVGSALNAYLVAGLVYSLSEAWWSYAGVISLAADRLRPTAALGLVMRLVGLALMGIAWSLGYKDPFVLALVYCGPLLLVLGVILPWAWRPKRMALFYNLGVRRYALWSQGIGLSTGWLGQLVPIVAGLTPGMSPTDLGVLSYVTRVLGAAMTPLQVLQSIIIKLVAQCKDAQAPAVKRYDRWFKAATLVLAVFYSGGLLVGHWFYGVTWALCLSLAIQGLGLFIVSWHRVALTALMASQRARPLFLVGYLPVLLLTTGLAWPVSAWAGLLGLSILSTVGWTYIAFSWRIPFVRSS